MKVAIIGAGISGLSCAIELERHGIKPIILEKRAHVGEALDYSTIWPRIINRTITDSLKYIKQEYSLELTPLNRIKKMIMFSTDHSAIERGSLVLVVNGITSYELDYYWKEFLFTENIDYYISCTIDIEHNCGFVQPLQVGNILFAGNAAGFTDNLIGCGGFNAIESGMLAARAIVYKKDYNILTKPIFEDIVKLHELRKAFNTLENNQINLLIKTLSLPLIKNAMYNNPFFRMSDMAKSVRLYNFLVKRKRHAVK